VATTTPAVTRLPTPAPATLTVTSDDFTNGGQIPDKFICNTAIAPTIHWSGDLRGSVSVAVVVQDLNNADFVHRIVLDLPPTTTSLGTAAPPNSHEALNSTDALGWFPPCPQAGTNRYRFAVYGLNVATGLPDGARTAAALAAINAHALAQGQIIGLGSAQPSAGIA
jgi:phosphatidylethanolamine-binding protein (PEBP) family uncharacterized protein